MKLDELGLVPRSRGRLITSRTVNTFILSPILFNCYISDLPPIFDDTCTPPQLADKPLSCLLYADDLVIMSETAQGLQNALHKLGE